MDHVAEGFSVTVRSERARMKMSLRDFATLVGVSVSSVKRWEAGTSEPSEAQKESVFSTLAAGQRYQPGIVGVHPGWWLRSVRHAERVSIRRAGELTGVSPSAWQRLETGQVRLGLGQAQCLAMAIGGSDTTSAIGEQQGLALLARLLGERGQAPTKESCFEMAELAQSLMQMGDHDLCGQAYQLAYQMGKRLEIEPDTLARWKLSSLWVGFPVIKAPRFAGARLTWLESRLDQVSPDVKDDYGIVRAMLLDWCGYPSLAKEMLDRPHRSPAYLELATLMRGWFEARYGDPLVAIRIVEPAFEASDNSQFLARKVALEACLQLDDLANAADHYVALEAIRERTGFWSPDLTARRKRLNL